MMYSTVGDTHLYPNEKTNYIGVIPGGACIKCKREEIVMSMQAGENTLWYDVVIKFQSWKG